VIHQTNTDQKIVIRDGSIYLRYVSIPLAVGEVEVQQDFEKKRERVILGIEQKRTQHFADAWQHLMHATWAPDAPGVVTPPELVDPVADPDDRLVASSFILEEGLVTKPGLAHPARPAAPLEIAPSLVVSGYSPADQRRVLHIANVCYCQLRCANAGRNHSLLILECRQHPPSLRLFDGRVPHAG
jgi:hypothetical protein